MRPATKFHALSATGRIANIPSVVGNVWLGIALAAAARGGLPDGHFWGLAAALGLAGMCLYLAGNFLNDWADRDWDAAHRPERALPQALFAPGIYLSVALACGTLGLSIAAAVHPRCLVVALVIGLCIVLYTRVHKRAAWSVIPMGLCRALLPVLGWAGFATPAASQLDGRGPATAAVAACACGLFFHIAGLSLSAKHEATDPPAGGGSGLSRVLFPAAALAMLLASYLLLSLPLLFCVLGLLPYGLWICLGLAFFRTPVQRHVANLLAGIPLVDWIVLLPLALTLGADQRAQPLPSLCLLLPPLAFCSGRLLQRLAPAT
jgi:4-hydroxybenzoate polyprenyltransferase